MDRSAASDLLLRQGLRALAKNLPAATRGDVNALHQARVASRRMREALPLVAPGKRLSKLQRQVRRITRALGPVRELDVALQMLDELDRAGDGSHQAVARLREVVAGERLRVQADMKGRLERLDLQKLRKRALAASRRGDDKSKQRTARDSERLSCVRQRAARRADRLRAAVENASSIYLPDRLHEVRIAVKKLRYSVEMVRQLSPSRTRPTSSTTKRATSVTARLRTLKHVQDLLGRIHDLEVLIARTRALQGAPNAPSLKTSAELDRIVRRLEMETRRLHGHYTASRDGLLAICDQTIAGASGKPRAAA
jgi:CHAD domain-containing protein